MSEDEDEARMFCAAFMLSAAAAIMFGVDSVAGGACAIFALGPLTALPETAAAKRP